MISVPVELSQPRLGSWIYFFYFIIHGSVDFCRISSFLLSMNVCNAILFPQNAAKKARMLVMIYSIYHWPMMAGDDLLRKRIYYI